MPWLLRVATRYAWWLVRRRMHASLEMAEMVPDPRALLESREEWADAMAALPLLPRRQQAFLAAAAVGVTRADLVGCTSTTERTWDRQLWRARRRLRVRVSRLRPAGS